MKQDLLGKLASVFRTMRSQYRHDTAAKSKPPGARAPGGILV
ncbi:MAG: hypothetical protein WBD83_20130 [Xanthobacteraceae bacterium]